MPRLSVKERKGVTLLLAIIVLSILLSAGLNLTFIATKELGFSRLAADSIKAHYAAESALECAIYWMFHPSGSDFFSISGTNFIYCNDEEISVGGGTDSTIALGGGTDQFSAVNVERLPDYTKRNFKLTSEGFNEDASLGSDPNLVQQELGAVSIEGCLFTPDLADADGDTLGAVNIETDELQDTLDDTFGPGILDADVDNQAFQTWNIGAAAGAGATVDLEIMPLPNDAGNTNLFGWYLNEPGGLFANSDEILTTMAFEPVFSNKDIWYDSVFFAGTAAPDHDRSNSGNWIPFTIDVNPDTLIGFGIRSREGGTVDFRSTEATLNDGDNPHTVSFLVPNPVDPEIPEFVIAFEDNYSDRDYDDMVVVVRVVNCVTNLSRY